MVSKMLTAKFTEKYQISKLLKKNRYVINDIDNCTKGSAFLQKYGNIDCQKI